MAEGKKTVVRRIKADASAENSAKKTEKSAENPAKKPAKSSRVTPKIVEFEGKKVSAAKAEKLAQKESRRVKKGRSPRRKTFVLLVPFVAIGHYFRESWHELRETEWTNRRKTWALTLAVILFTAFFAVFVLVFDWIFNWVVKDIIL